MLTPMLQQRARKVYVTGGTTEQMRAAWEGQLELAWVEDFEACVRAAFADSVPGDIIVLSPPVPASTAFATTSTAARFSRRSCSGSGANMKKNRNTSYIVSIDNTILGCYLALLVIGLLVMLDITSVQSTMVNFYRHAVFVGVSVLAAIITVYFVKVDKLRPLNRWLVYLIMGLLVLVFLIGVKTKGAERWLMIGPVGIQPSTMARLVLILFFAGYLDSKQDKINLANVKELGMEFIPLILYTVVIFVLIFLGKHLSTLIIGGATLLGMLFYAGLRKRFVLGVLMLGLIAGTVIIAKGDSFRSDRINTYKVYSLLVPNRPAPSNSAEEYQVKESLTALTSGGFLGTGMAHGRANTISCLKPAPTISTPSSARNSASLARPLCCCCTPCSFSASSSWPKRRKTAIISI